MEDNKYIELESSQEQGEKSSFDFQTIYTTLVLNWKWFLLSLIICLGSAAIYLRYSTKIYQATEKLLIKDDETSGRRGGANNIQNVTNLGFITNSNGIDNEMEILTSHSLAAQTVRDLKLYVNYKLEGRVKDHLLYRTQPITVDIDPSHLEKIAGSIQLTITPEGNNYHVIGQYYVSVDENSVEGPFFIDKSFSTMPATIGTRAGVLSFTANTSSPLKDGRAEKVTIVSPTTASYKYMAALTVNQTSKTTTIAQLTLKDEIPQRAIDYLKQLVICYNEQANDDKNEIARRTEIGKNQCRIRQYRRSTFQLQTGQ